jgi:uncharacterized membrane protein YphA (DoxX/SURF4 family)
MKTTKMINIFSLVAAFLLGLILMWGGFKKFEKPMPSPYTQIENIKKGDLEGINETTLKIKNYIFGMKQTNYFWQFLGIAEFVAGLLLFSQVLRFGGAVIAMPITLNIFLFHIFLEPHDSGELIETGLMLLGNIWLIAAEFPKWKVVLFNKSIV